MRHGKKVNHLGRTDSHRKAMMSNMATSLILHKRITTTLAKAKALRVYVEPLITKSKSDTTHSRRTVFSYLQDKDAVSILFREVAEKVASRPGGYTRIIKMENRLGDNAEMAMIELVDYNTVYTKGDAAVAKKSTRRRGGSGKGKTTEAAPAAEVKAEPVAAVVEEPKAAAPVAEAAAPVVAEEAAPAAEEAPEAPAANEENAEKGE
ncbi:50S ribosomal protein L17 [Mucilaginibacter boryungensis]|uniref:Large ribosomal subunit protein bL17 n=1 Tax=Mucilaginibacter boryungensis TaxID=768480 RepID=A0ABR9XJV5_9SPHI|nr:50S ribosomal protein L17 [Mucilaginibacter boryungensis]MBE9667667.1 50S ribosomal protein L17 [Mucilaginibacter boryungensis]